MYDLGSFSDAPRMGHWQWSLGLENASVGSARRLVAGAITTLDRDVAEVTLLLTSEVVTNALRYGTGDVLHVTLDIMADRLRVEVVDQVERTPHLRIPDQLDDRGLGLMLLDALSTTWGAAAPGGSKTVWFELALQAARVEPDRVSLTSSPRADVRPSRR